MEASTLTRQSTKVHVPTDFYCPISGDLMVDPVSEPSGHTYERSQIMVWLQTSSTSPLTRVPLTQDELTTNVAVRNAIDEIRGKLAENQLKIDSRIAEIETREYIDKLDEISLESFYDDNKLFIKVNTPPVDVRAPVDVVLCIDISGSMGSEAPIRGARGENISTNVSVLSLTVTAAKTILDSLNEHDNVSIVVYTTQARIVVENMACSDENKIIVKHQLDELKPENTTNIWDGLHKSLEILRTTSPVTKQKNIFLLTDGVPNEVPPRGHEAMLNRYYGQHDFKCSVTTFGFGYCLMSDLLDNISTISGGDGFSYIPDSGLLGNIFIHGISNFLTTAISNPTMTIRLKNNARFSNGSNELVTNINSLKYGQSKNFVYDIDISMVPQGISRDKIAETVLHINGKDIMVNNSPFPDNTYKIEQVWRYKVIDCITKCSEYQKFSQRERVRDLINPLIEEMKGDMSLLANKFIQDMVTDLEGQVREALNMTDQGNREDWYNKWGKHYLLSLRGAYQNELCNNFKDQGVSNFGGELFNSIRDTVSDTFDGQPPPRQDIQQSHRGGGRRGGGSDRCSPPLPAPTSRSYNNSTGPCCSENSYITMSDYSKRQVKNIKKGDIVISYDKNMNKMTSVVECVVKTHCIDMCPMININRLNITPYHPIIYNGKWTFPIDVAIGKNIYIDTEYIYSIVTNNRNNIIVEDYIFATFGHGIQGNVIGHNFFGTENVINDIKKFNTYNDGYVILQPHMIKRDDNMLVCNIIEN